MIYKYLYPARWEELARECKERASWHCEHCGVKHGTPRISSITGQLYVVYLQAAHVNHDKQSETPELKAVCPSCHWRHYRQRSKSREQQWLRAHWSSLSLLEPELEHFER